MVQIANGVQMFVLAVVVALNIYITVEQIIKGGRKNDR